MSVKVHEAFCIDSFQDRLLFSDDFLGDSIRDLWNTTIVGAGSIAVVDAQDGGVVRLTTGAVSGNSSLLSWNDIRSLHVNKQVTMEWRMKFGATTNMISGCALFFDVGNYVFFEFNTLADTTWHIACRDGGVSDDQDTGITPDTDYHIYRIECFPTGEVHFYYDETEVTNSPITTRIPDDAGDYLQPRFYLDTREAASKTEDIDYVAVRQEI